MFQWPLLPDLIGLIQKSEPEVMVQLTRTVSKFMTDTSTLNSLLFLTFSILSCFKNHDFVTSSNCFSFLYKLFILLLELFRREFPKTAICYKIQLKIVCFNPIKKVLMSRNLTQEKFQNFQLLLTLMVRVSNVLGLEVSKFLPF